MRYSDGIKRYDKETKQRLFDEIMTAVDNREKTDRILSSKSSFSLGEEEEIIMNRNGENIRVGARARGSVIAAACAVIAVTGTAAALSKLNVKPIEPASTVDEVVTDAQDNTNENAVTEGKKSETVMNFEEMEKNSEYVTEFTVAKAELVTVCENGCVAAGQPVDERGATGKPIASYIDYTVLTLSNNSELNNDPDYNALMDDIMNGAESYEDHIVELAMLEKSQQEIKYPEEYIDDINNDVIPEHYMQYVGGPEISIENDMDAVKIAKPGERILVFADKDGKVNRNLEQEKAFELYGKDPVFILDKDNFEYKSVTHPDEDCSEVTDFVFDCLDKDEDGYVVYEYWFAYNGFDSEIRYVTEFDGAKKKNGEVTGIEWPSEKNGYKATIGVFDAFADLDPEIKNRLEGADTFEFNISDKGRTTQEFGDHNIELGGMTYDGKSGEFYIFFDVTRKDGGQIDGTVELSYDDLSQLKTATGARDIEVQVDRNTYDGDSIDNNTVRTGLTLSVDDSIAAIKTTPITIRINGLKVGNEEIKGQYEVTFNIDFDDALSNGTQDQDEDQYLNSSKFHVDPQQVWNDTEIDVDGSVEIVYLGGVCTVSDNVKDCDADGDERYRGQEGYLLEGANEGALIAKIGENGEPILVGNGTKITGQSGRLYLGVNDDVYKKYGNGYDDNSGSYSLDIKF